MQGSTIWEPESNDLKARVHAHQVQMPVLDKGARVCPGPWPNLGVVAIYLDTCRESASLLEGEQNIDLPRVGSERCAAQLAPQTFPFSPFPPDTLACENPPGEGAAIERHTTEDLCPKCLKLPDAQAEDQLEAGGVPSIPGESPVALEVIDPFGSAGVAENADAEKSNPQVLVCTNEGEHCRLWVLHQP